MRNFLLIAICFYSCRGVYNKPSLKKETVTIDGIGLVQAFDKTLKVDSSYVDTPNACFYTSNDSCEYLLINGSWRIKEADSLYFSSIDITPGSVVEIMQREVNSQSTLKQLEAVLRKFEYNILEWKSKNEKVLVIKTSDNCQLHFRFENKKLKQVVYGVFAYY